MRNRDSGFSLVELLVAAGILSLLIYASMTFFTQQLKTANYLEFQSKRDQLRGTLLGQVLNNPINCKCLFMGASAFDASGTPELQGFAQPQAIGKFSAPDCTGGIGVSFITSAGADGMKLTSTSLKNIVRVGGTYSGDFVLELESIKEVLGPKNLTLKIPVSVAVRSPVGPSVTFDSCRFGAGSAFDISDLDFATTGSMTLAANAIGLIPVTTDPTVRGAALTLMYTGAQDHCLGVMSVDNTREVMKIGGRVNNGNLTDFGGMIIAPVDSNGRVHIRNTTSGRCNPSRLMYTFQYTIIALIR